MRLSAALADRYRVERELGRGGMATVYLAHDIKHSRDVAIKVLHPDLGAALGGERFLAEIKTTAKLQHHCRWTVRRGGQIGQRDRRRHWAHLAGHPHPPRAAGGQRARARSWKRTAGPEAALFPCQAPSLTNWDVR